MSRTFARACAAVLLGAICACTTPAEPRTGPPLPRAKPEQNEPRHQLQPLLQALAALDAGTAKEPVSIVQIGDSHTAGDFLSGKLRELFQQRFGAAGRGLLPPGLADRYYDPRLVSVAEDGEWQRISARPADATGPFGVAGVIKWTPAGGRRMTLASDEAQGFDRVFVEFMRQPNGGSFRLSVGNMPLVTVATAAAAPTPDWLEQEVRPGSQSLALDTIGDGQVMILAWGTARHVAGVLYQNFGVIGATVDAIGRDDPNVLRLEMARLKPALIIVAFGTNEAFGNPADLEDYQQLFTDRVRRLQEAAPGAAIAVIGPPDVNKRYPAGAVDGHPCSKPPKKKGRGTRLVWARPRQLDRVLAAERAAAKHEGWYFWDWSRAMGGTCAMHRWASAATPRGRSDHVHMMAAGYDATAEMFFHDLMAQYDAYRRSH
jgi:lysophospholipase L1-like esterase